MKNRNIKQIVFTATTVLLLSACDSNPSADVTVPQCGDAADMGKTNAIAVFDKKIEKLDNEAEVRIWHSPNLDKLVCMIKGEARIVDIN